MVSRIRLDMVQSPITIHFWNPDTPFESGHEAINVSFLHRLPTIIQLVNTKYGPSHLRCVLKGLSQPGESGMHSCPQLKEVRLKAPGTLEESDFKSLIQHIRDFVRVRPRLKVYDGSGVLFRM